MITQFLKALDFQSNGFSMTFNGETRFKSVFNGIISIFLILVTIAYTIYSSIYYFQGKDYKKIFKISFNK